MHDLSCETEDGNTVHLTSVNPGRIRMRLQHNRHLLEKYFYPDDGSFQFISITIYDCDMFRMYPDNLAIIGQARDIKVSTPRILMSPTITEHQFTPADIFKKNIKRDA